MDKRTIFTPSKHNHLFLERMKNKGVDKSSIINLALSLLAPKLGNIGTNDDRIIKTIFDAKINKIEETLTEQDYDF